MSLSNTATLADALAARRRADPETGELPDGAGSLKASAAPSTAAVVSTDQFAAPAPASVAYSVEGAPPAVLGGLPWAATYMKLAKTIAWTEFVPGELRGSPDKVMAAMMYGFELGLEPVKALNYIQVIDGRASLKPEGMRALILHDGHGFIVEGDEETCAVDCHRKEWPADRWVRVTWTMAEARRAGLVRPKSGWEKYPSDMLMARATGRAARAHFADVVAGLSYTPEELEDMALEAQETRPETPKRRRRAAGGSDTSPQPPPVPDPLEVEAQPEPEPEATGPTPLRSAPETPAETPAAPAPPVRNDTGAQGVKAEMVGALNAMLREKPRHEATLIRAYLAQHGLGNVSTLDLDDVQRAINVVAGWPTSVEADDEDAVDAEIVGDGPDLTAVDARLAGDELPL